nr:ras-related protein Rab-15 isoform X2 [Parasteatoda tepidariorum]
MAKNVNKDRPSDFYFKLILLGDYNVGKTSIFRRFKDNEFKESGNLSVGIDNYSKVIEVDGQNVTLVLWDTVGTERFRTLTRNYFRNADACLIVFSSNEPETLTSLTQWVRDADDFSENGEGIQEMFKTIAQKLILKSSRVQKNQSLFERDVHQLDAHEVDVKATCC